MGDIITSLFVNQLQSTVFFSKQLQALKEQQLALLMSSREHQSVDDSSAVEQGNFISS
jgi:hypothetical protein